MPNLFQSCQVSHRVRGTAAPRKRSNLFFCGGVYAAKNTLRETQCLDWPTASQGMK